MVTKRVTVSECKECGTTVSVTLPADALVTDKALLMFKQWLKARHVAHCSQN